MKGVSPLSRMILFIGVIMVSMIILYVVAAGIVVPGASARGEIESATIAYSLVSSINALSSMEQGRVEGVLYNTYDIKVVESWGEKYLEITREGKTKRARILGNVKTPLSLTGVDTVSIIKKPGELVEILGISEITLCTEPGREKILSYVESAIKTHGLPYVDKPKEFVVEVIQQESGFKQCNDRGTILKSNAGALGIMQLMPGTAQDLGYPHTEAGRHCNIEVDPKKPDQNVEGGVCYLSYLMSKYKSTKLALAAYNCGPGNIDKAISKYGSTWDNVEPHIGEFCDKLHGGAETRNYVAGIYGRYSGKV